MQQMIYSALKQRYKEVQSKWSKSAHSCSCTAIYIMKTSFIVLCSLAFVAAAPFSGGIESRTLGAHGSYTVSGLGARKKAITACGGGTLDLAIAMLE